MLFSGGRYAAVDIFVPNDVRSIASVAGMRMGLRMSQNSRWRQYLCAQCQHVNFIPAHNLVPELTPCAHCGAEALNVIENVFRIEMPKFRAGNSAKIA
jgi:hypothetical protein